MSPGKSGKNGLRTEGSALLKVQAQGAQVGARLQLEQGRLPSEERVLSFK